jgi:FkbM family methyltransferase
MINRLVGILRLLIDRFPFMRSLAYFVYRVIFIQSERWITVHGVPILVDIHDYGIGTQLFLQGTYGAGRVTEIRKIVKEGDTVIDIGANIGYFTVLLASIVGNEGKVYAFEPDPRNTKLLKRTIERNGWKNVFLVNNAVSNMVGELTLYQTHSHAGNSISQCESESTVKVDVVTIDSVLNMQKVSFIKMDMDGSEPLAIIGMKNLILRSPNLKILAEYQPSNLRRYINNPLDFILIANNNGLLLEGILDTETGRLPTLSLTPLENIKEGDNLDVIFARKENL